MLNIKYENISNEELRKLGKKYGMYLLGMQNKRLLNSEIIGQIKHIDKVWEKHSPDFTDEEAIILDYYESLQNELHNRNISRFDELDGEQKAHEYYWEIELGNNWRDMFNGL